MLKRHRNRILIALSLVFTVLSLGYLAKGFYVLISRPLGPTDLIQRWIEQQYIYLGIYPYYMNPADIHPDLGEVKSGGYPPWAFFTGFFIFPPISLFLTRLYHACLNVFSLGILARFSYQIGRPFGQVPAWLFIVATLALGSHSRTLGKGQYGIIINAILILIYWCLQTNRNSLVGILMGVALAKPSSSLAHILTLIVNRKIKSLAIAFFYIAVATFHISWLTRLGFQDNAVLRFFNQLKYVADDGSSGINILVNLGISTEITVLLLTLIALLLGVAAFIQLRHAPLLTLFAIASVIGRVFTYHRSYDDVMLVFLLLALLELAFNRPHWLNYLSVALVGITLWFPLGVQAFGGPPWLMVQVVIWLAAGGYLLLNVKRQTAL